MKKSEKGDCPLFHSFCYSITILSFSMYAYLHSCSCSASSFSISFTILEILICGHSISCAAIIAFLFPFAPACASPLK